jgi:hypothetical protein
VDLMGRVTTEVRALLQERQDWRKAELDAHRRDVHFAVGDAEHTPSRRSCCSRRAGWAPSRCSRARRPTRLDVRTSRWRIFPEFNV